MCERMKKIIITYQNIKAQKNKANRKISSKNIRKCRRKNFMFLSSRKNASHIKVRQPYITVEAPAHLDLFKKTNHSKMMLFISDLESKARSCVSGNKALRICFRNTKTITAPAGLYLLAVTENIVDEHSNLIFKTDTPPKLTNKITHENISIVQAVLKRIGFYRLIKNSAPKFKRLNSVDCWHTDSSALVNSESLGVAIQKFELHETNASDLFRSGIEAMSNAAEHAYLKQLEPIKKVSKKYWWMFTAIMDGNLIVYICDLGHGIPRTLPITQKDSLLEKIGIKIKSIFTAEQQLVGDVYHILASMMVKETRTKEIYRGKGGKDIRSFIDSNRNAKLHIFSNKGHLRYSNSNGDNEKYVGYNNKHSINGTIVGWSMPLSKSTEDLKNV
jgi:hypothetical protein